MILVYVTNENLDQAQKIANYLLQKRLIACANFFPITSLCKNSQKTIDFSQWMSVAKQ